MEQLKETALNPDHDLLSEEEKHQHLTEEMGELRLSSEMSEEQIEERFAKLLGKKKPAHLRTQADEAALAEAQAKRQRKAQKRKHAVS